MSDEIETVTTDELPPITDVATQLPETSLVAVLGAGLVDYYATIRQFITALGTAILSTGDIAAAGAYGAIVLTIKNRTVGLAQIKTGTANTIIGYAPDGTPHEYTAGANVTIASNQISMSAPAGAAPSTTVFTHNAFNGF